MAFVGIRGGIFKVSKGFRIVFEVPAKSFREKTLGGLTLTIHVWYIYLHLGF